jgi:hypothetical protein
MHKEAQRAHEALRDAEYRKSTYSSGAQECVTVGFAGVWAGVKDTKNPTALLAVPAQGFAQLVKAVKTDLR